MDALKAILVSVLTASGLIGIFTKFILSKMKTLRLRQQALELGIQALLRNALIQQYDYWAPKNRVPVHIKDNFANMYQQYHALGANGVMDGMYQSFMDMPTVVLDSDD